MPRMISRGQRPQRRIAVIVAALVVLLFFSRSICGFVIDYLWWRELDQVPTWVLTSVYRYAPGLAAWFVLFIVWWIAHARGMIHAGARLRDHVVYARIATLGIGLVSLVVGISTVDGWTVARYMGGRD